MDYQRLRTEAQICHFHVVACTLWLPRCSFHVVTSTLLLLSRGAMFKLSTKILTAVLLFYNVCFPSCHFHVVASTLLTTSTLSLLRCRFHVVASTLLLLSRCRFHVQDPGPGSSAFSTSKADMFYLNFFCCFFHISSR